MTAFSATLLLTEPFQLGTAALVQGLGVLWPDASVSEHPDDLSALSVDGIGVTIASGDAPVAASVMTPPMTTLRAQQTLAAAERHTAFVRITAQGSPDDPQRAATVLHAVVAAAVERTPALAVFWGSSWALVRPERVVETASMAASGRLALGLWASLATVSPRGDQGAVGVVTYGLQPFLGRELEYAPCHAETRDVVARVSGLAQRLLDQRPALSDRQRIIIAPGQPSVVARLRDSWLRTDIPAAVIVAEDSIIDPETLGRFAETPAA